MRRRIYFLGETAAFFLLVVCIFACARLLSGQSCATEGVGGPALSCESLAPRLTHFSTRAFGFCSFQRAPFVCGQNDLRSEVCHPVVMS